MHAFKRMCTSVLAGTLLGAAVTAVASTAVASTAAEAPEGIDPALSALIASPERSAPFVARDGARHPAEELAFFGLQPAMSVVELWPGTGYWTEILGPYLAAHGHYTVALPRPRADGEGEGVARWSARVEQQKARLGTIVRTTLGAGQYDIAPPGSADLVVTFRNLHNWMHDGDADKVLAACYQALKPGGILGIEDHRGRSDQPQDPKAEDGYVRQDYAIALAKQAGFEFVGASEINANPRDTKNWPEGVWTLPPTLELKDKDRERYQAIGEADNFVLKFRKPAR
jgi:predicted methyltransferase